MSSVAKVTANVADYPGYTPVQFDPKKFTLPLGWLDWWGPRSWCCGPCNPLIRCIGGRCNPCLVQQVDIVDPTIWKQTLEMPTPCPERLKGVWWLCDNIAAETVVCFNEAKWTDLGNNEWRFEHDLPQTWSRDDGVFGGILGAVNAYRGLKGCNCNSPWPAINFVFNLETGKGVGDLSERTWRIDEDEWQKANYNKPADEPDAEINFMYRWRRVIRGDGSTTPAFEEMKQILTSPYPHRNCLEPWCVCWPMLLTKEERLKDMAYSNRNQLVIWRPEHRKPVCSCAGMSCTCPCMCPLAKGADGKYKEWLDSTNELGKQAEERPYQESMDPLLPGRT